MSLLSRLRHSELLSFKSEAKKENEQEPTQVVQTHDPRVFDCLYESPRPHRQKQTVYVSLPSGFEPIQTFSRSLPNIAAREDRCAPDFEDQLHRINVECGGRSFMINYGLNKSLAAQSFMFRNGFFKRGGKKKDDKPRVTYFNGGNAFFKFNYWPQVFIHRATDIKAGMPFYDNDAVYSDEGIKAFFELDYASKERPMPADQILRHARACQDLMREYFQVNPQVDFRMWVLTCEPKEKKGVISNGAHVIFPEIVITAAQGHQLCSSLAALIGNKFGLSKVVDDCYKEEATTLRPIYALKTGSCPRCQLQKNIQMNCAVCERRGKVGLGSYYEPTYLFSSSGELLQEERDRLVEHSLAQVCYETSIVGPSDMGAYTSGFFIPAREEKAVPPEERSKSKKDQDKHYMYKRDRQVMSRLRAEEVTEKCLLDIVRTIVRKYHPEYRLALLASVSRKSKCYLVNLKSGGRSFCRIQDFDGKQHSNNRVYFRISQRGIEQYCYNKDCGKSRTKSVGARLLRPISLTFRRMLFPDRSVQTKPKTRAEMLDSCSQYIKKYV